MKARRSRTARFLRDIREHTPLFALLALLIVSWLLFSTALYVAERGLPDSPGERFGAALYWGVAAFSTAGIAQTPLSGAGQFIGGLWILLGSLLYFGAIVATVTAYFMRPMQRPVHQLVDTIEYNLEQLDQLSLDELELLKETVDELIDHMERLHGRDA